MPAPPFLELRAARGNDPVTAAACARADRANCKEYGDSGDERYMTERLSRRLGGGRVIAALLVLGLSSLGLLAYFSLSLGSDAVRRQAQARLGAASSISGTYIDDKMGGFRTVVGLFAQRPDLVADLGDGSIAHYDLAQIGFQLGQLCGMETEFGYCFLSDPGGKLIASSPNDPTIVGQNFSFRDWYQGALRTGQPYVSEAYVSAFADHPRVVAIAVPVHPLGNGAVPGRILGIVVVTVSLDQIQAFTTNFAQAQGVTLMVTDRHGTMLARPGMSQTGLTYALSDARVARALAGKTGVTSEGGTLYAYAPVSGLNWAVVASVPLAVALADVDQLRTAVLGIGGALALIFLMGGGVLSLAHRRQRRMERLFDLSIDMLAISDFDGHFVQLNAAWERTLGWTERELRTTPYFDFVHEDDRQATLAEAARIAEGAAVLRFENRYRCKDGSYRWLQWTSMPVPKQRLIYGTAKDITEARAAQEALNRSRDRIRLILDNAADGIVTFSPQGVIESANPTTHALFGYEPGTLNGQRIETLIAQAYQVDFASNLRTYLRPEKEGWTSGSMETVGLRKDGSTFPLEFLASQMALGAERLLIGTLRDITERKAERDALEVRLLHDSLTGLPNRTLFADRLRQAIRYGQRDRSPRGLLIMDLNRFKEVNDTLGHVRGDLLLQEVAARLREVVRAGDTVARLGGDEFAIVWSQAADAHQALTAARRVMEMFDAPFTAGGAAIDLKASLGIAVFPDHGQDADTLLRHAEVAMYIAKREQLGVAVYAADLDENHPDRLELRGEVRYALAQGELVLHYQPIVNLKTGEPEVAEALVRWQHPKHGLLLPARFLPFIEGTELITPLTHWVLREAAGQVQSWSEAGLGLDVAVNLSALTLQDATFAGTVAEVLRARNVPPTRLQFEITESTIMTSRADEALQALSALGVRFAIDDFGTGYSSMAYLNRLPVDIIKVDRSFVTEMTANLTGEAIVRSITQLGHSLGCKVVAEGVETEEVLAALRALGVDYVQGFLYAKPLPAAAFTEWVRDRVSAGQKAA
ncbi:MAG TPA: EAL domain-containing protein [Candidatus Limnocylindrales bacterium]|nr:EAL domain-containing protein [Candidatus Limnocylindrales bacterium]